MPNEIEFFISNWNSDLLTLYQIKIFGFWIRALNRTSPNWNIRRISRWNLAGIHHLLN